MGKKKGMDRKELLDKVYGDTDLLVEIIDTFLDMAPDSLDSIRRAIESNDASKVCESAHFLQGSVGNFEQGLAFQAALELETIGRSGDLSRAYEAFETLKIELENLNYSLKIFSSELRP